jgi:16S rRNA (uracil1498-N3)-methyltransferase
LVEAEHEGVRLLAHPEGLARASWPRGRQGQSVILAVGPEGGFSDAEVNHARERGWSIVGLGSTTLRIETAGLVGCSSVLAQSEGWFE